MKLFYTLSIASLVVGLTLKTTEGSAQCFGAAGSGTNPAGQTITPAGNWGPAFTVPPNITAVRTNITTTAGSNLATIPGGGCNAALLAAGTGISGPNIPGGTTVMAGSVCTTANGLILSQPATTSGVATYTFTYPAWSSPVPPTGAGTFLNQTCTVCPALFTASLCAGNYVSMQMCLGNMYTFSMCGSPAWNSTITITNNLGTVLASGSPTYDDDGCGTPGGHATITFVPTATGTSYIRLLANPCLVNGTLCGTMQVACNPIPAPPVNDNPAAATVLPMSTACNFTSATNSWSTTTNPPGTPQFCAPGCAAGGAGYGGYDVWFQTTVPASGNLSVQTELVSATNIAMAVYTGIPGLLTQANGPGFCGSCNDDSSPGILNPFLTLSGLAGGSTVYIRVWSVGGLSSMGTFRVCAYEPIPPPNDNPCAATVLPVNNSCSFQSFTTESATGLVGFVTASGPSCGTPIVGGDVWFAVTPASTGSVTINSQAGSLTDMAMAVYTLTAGTLCTPGPGTLTEVPGGCNDNFGASTMPSVTFGATAGVTYYVRMWNKTAAFGTASICAIFNVPPPNDDPCGAIPLAVNTGCVFPAAFSTQFATVTGGVPNPSCVAGPYNSDVWFTAVIPASGQLNLDTDNGTMTDGGMAVYTGTCGALTQVAVGNGGCVVTGSTNPVGGPMPGTTITGVPAGTTVYIRVWRQSGNDGTFFICARNPQNPAGCFFTLNMSDAGGDGWNGGFVTVCVNAACTNYTVTGSLANITFSAPTGSSLTLQYTPAGGFQNQISYSLLASNGFSLFNSGSPPTAGFSYGVTVNATCNVPPAPPEDCLGSIQVCNTQSFSYPPSGPGNTQDLNAGNHGCILLNERQGVWLRFTSNAAGTIAFTINIGAGTDYDFGVWGPFPSTPPCPPSGPPTWCNWSGTTGPTGLNYTSLQFSVPATGPAFSHWIDVPGPNQNYLLYIDNFTMNGLAFTLQWNNVPTNILDCILPVEFLEFEAFPKPRQVDLKWATASEHNSAYFNVERSGDGQTYQPIGIVAAAGSSQTLTEYSFVDDEPLKGVNYYRLDQVDADGARAYSKVVTAVYRYGNVPLNVYPNPAGESLWASFELPDEGTVKWRILDASGRLVRVGQAAVGAGTNQLEVPLDIDAGSYLLELVDDAGVPLGNARFVRR